MCEKYVKHSWCGSHVTNHLMCKIADNEFSTYFRETGSLLGHHLPCFSRINFPCYPISLRQGGEDKLLWAPSKEGKFNVCSFYNVLISHVSNPFLWKSIWQTKVPSSVAFFAWTVSLGKDLTIDNMRTKDTLLLFIGTTCVREVGESMDHLLLHCKMASAWWSIFLVRLGWLGLDHVLKNNVSFWLLRRVRWEPTLKCYGKCFPLASYGVFGGKCTVEILGVVLVQK